MKIIITLLAVAGFSTTAMAEDGAALFAAKHCGACHTAGKPGGDLRGSKLDKAALVKFMKDPKAAKPGVTMAAVKATDAELDALADYILGLKK